MGPKANTNAGLYCHFAQPSSEKIIGIARGLSESAFADEFRSARLFQTALGSSLKTDQVNGCSFFWFVFFRQVKKMNYYVKSFFIVNIQINYWK
jgi:hypothetical protein